MSRSTFEPSTCRVVRVRDGARLAEGLDLHEALADSRERGHGHRVERESDGAVLAVVSSQPRERVEEVAS